MFFFLIDLIAFLLSANCGSKTQSKAGLSGLVFNLTMHYKRSFILRRPRGGTFASTLRLAIGDVQ
jgi:hypothetical protein